MTPPAGMTKSPNGACKTLTFSDDEADLLQKYERRTGFDIKDFIIETLSDYYEPVTPCLWREYTEDDCKDCPFKENPFSTCPDRKHGVPA